MDINIRNAVIVALTQALLGSISNNFRAILIRTAKDLHIEFYIYQKLEEDMEEIEDIITEFDSLVMGIEAVAISYEVRVGTEKIDFSGEDITPIYIRRRQNFL
ncbi:hypothetical protein NK553_19925 [Pseudomonas sp. ZM23]|uniref:Uncharacterized protein n=1 Tax=Pseudomonas triclosanedens TaxID=2961893 RepID=A0ABY6ZQX2_9PSED|nr:hypothetical protein [Pseudomonas triclosanedens]MCP8466227.1 hypothetical protein [Pseudomonas triclosanedens]MCP8472462.1 hypothetical protein [Pseudomonas triclosanedens]MCP8477526.1 hypothetical protein [Pseudomonas triclosanedens]WAI47143.1 hypothetical protein OU419_15290 [Pseudomonas triclosanedens]